MNNLISHRLSSACLGLLVVFLAAGCGRDEIKTYRIAKEQNAPSQDMSAAQLPPESVGANQAGLPKLVWKTPDGWTEAPAGQMRVASFKIVSADGGQADVSVIPLPGAAGGDLANVNRWRGQVGLQPVSSDELANLAEPVEIAGEQASLYEQVGEQPGSGEKAGILGVILHRDGMAWFFKMTGDAGIVAQQKPAFVEFLKSLSFEEGQTMAMPSSTVPMDEMSLPDGHPPIANSALPAGHPDVSGMESADDLASDNAKPQWQVPTAWKEVAGGQFLVAKFVLSGEGGEEASVDVSMLAGDGGGLTANVNRWRRQLGLEALSSDQIAETVTGADMPGGRVTFIDLSGTDAKTGQPASLVGAVVPQAGQTWFYKLMGATGLVHAQKEAFTKFVETANY